MSTSVTVTGLIPGATVSAYPEAVWNAAVSSTVDDEGVATFEFSQDLPDGAKINIRQVSTSVRYVESST